MMGQRSVYNACRPEVHDVLRRWRKLAETYDPPRVLIGETYVLEPEAFARFYGDGDELNLAFNFMLLHSDFQARAAARRGRARGGAAARDAWPVWTGGNHDNHRFPTRWCKNDPAADARRAGHAARPAGHAVPLLRRRDRDDRHRRSRRSHPRSRSACSTARAWAATTSARRCTGPRNRAPGSRRRASSRGCRTATSPRATSPTSAHDPGSILSLTRDLIGLRDALPELRDGAYRTLPAPNDDVWVWLRGERTVVACNLSEADGRRRRRRARARSASRPTAHATRRPSTARCVSRRSKPRSCGATDGRRRGATANGRARRSRRGSSCRTQPTRSRSTRLRSASSTSNATAIPTASSRSRSSGSAAPTSGSRPIPRRARALTADPPVRMILSVDDPDAVFAARSPPARSSSTRSTKGTAGASAGSSTRSATTGRSAAARLVTLVTRTLRTGASRTTRAGRRRTSR